MVFSLHKKNPGILTIPGQSYGSGWRIRTLTYRVRVCCATFTQTRYVCPPQRTDIIIQKFAFLSIGISKIFFVFHRITIDVGQANKAELRHNNLASGMPAGAFVWSASRRITFTSRSARTPAAQRQGGAQPQGGPKTLLLLSYLLLFAGLRKAARPSQPPFQQLPYEAPQPLISRWVCCPICLTSLQNDRQ